MSRSLLVTLLLWTTTLPVLAMEGMWMPQQVPDLAPQLREIGFTGDPNAFADLTSHPMNAIVSLGGCSASFVSPDGLIATNHHCVLGALQFNSTPERNLLENGYVARSRDEELSNGPGARVFVTVAVREVTDELNARLTDTMSPRERYDAIERFGKDLVALCEKKQKGVRCRVQSFFENLRHFEITMLEIEDVRLVYAPHEGIGVFGGETDNWQWPRHTGDFALYRAYVGPDGAPRPYAKDNVPYRPAHFLKVSAKGASPGEVVVVAGYPGNTDRHATFGEVKDLAEIAYPRAIRRAKDQLALLDEVAAKDPAASIAAETKKRYTANSMINREGRLKGLLRGGLLAKKEARQRDLAAFIAADPARQKQWGDVLPALDALLAEKQTTRERDETLGALFSGSALLGAAQTIYRMSVELPKPDADREPEYQERNWKRMREGQVRMQRGYHPAVDRALFRYAALEAAALPAAQRIAEFDRFAGLSASMSVAERAKAIDALLDRLYGGTKLGEVDVRTGLLGKPTEGVLAAKDPFIDLAVALFPLSMELENRNKERSGRSQALRPRYMAALLAKNGGVVAPDANGTLRVTFGTVKGVRSRDGVEFLPQTTLSGILEKDTGSGDFKSPKALLDAIAAERTAAAAGKPSRFTDPRLGDVPVNFLSSVDTTGGNSGSATLNAKGEFVGLLFDGTYDTVASDLLYDTVRTRSIHCDVRYLLFTLQNVENATNILKELGQ